MHTRLESFWQSISLGEELTLIVFLTSLFLLPLVPFVGGFPILSRYLVLVDVFVIFPVSGLVLLFASLARAIRLIDELRRPK